MNSSDFHAQVSALFVRLNSLGAREQAVVAAYSSTAIQSLRVAIDVAEGMSRAGETPPPALSSSPRVTLAAVDGRAIASTEFRDVHVAS
jgi:hypothetical protein